MHWGALVFTEVINWLGALGLAPPPTVMTLQTNNLKICLPGEWLTHLDLPELSFFQDWKTHVPRTSSVLGILPHLLPYLPGWSNYLPFKLRMTRKKLETTCGVSLAERNRDTQRNLGSRREHTRQVFPRRDSVERTRWYGWCDGIHHSTSLKHDHPFSLLPTSPLSLM